MQRFLKKQPPKEHNTTIGVEFSVATVQIDQDTNIQLQLWDTVTNSHSHKEDIHNFS